MEGWAEEEEVVKALEKSLTQMKWRLKRQSKRRLQTDVMGLCTGMRPVVMVDYGGTMPHLQPLLCSFLLLCQNESTRFQHLRVMVVEDMIYFVHVRGLAEYVHSCLNSDVELWFVNLERDPPQMVAHAEEHPLKKELTKVQKLFSLEFPLEGTNKDMTSSVADAGSSSNSAPLSCSSECIDLSRCLQDNEVTVPTLNGWLLGYPVVYLFSKAHIGDAIYNLSMSDLHIFKILVSRNLSHDRGSQPEELMSFSVPYELSTRGSKEPWAETFLAQLQSKWNKCKQTWRSLEMEVTECSPQAIVL